MCTLTKGWCYENNITGDFTFGLVFLTAVGATRETVNAATAARRRPVISRRQRKR